MTSAVIGFQDTSLFAPMHNPHALQVEKPTESAIDVVNLASNGKVGADDVAGSSSALPFDQLHMVGVTHADLLLRRPHHQTCTLHVLELARQLSFVRYPFRLHIILHSACEQSA